MKLLALRAAHDGALALHGALCARVEHRGQAVLRAWCWRAIDSCGDCRWFDNTVYRRMSGALMFAEGHY